MGGVGSVGGKKGKEGEEDITALREVKSQKSKVKKGMQAPEFIYGKRRKYVFRDAQRKKYYVHATSP